MHTIDVFSVIFLGLTALAGISCMLFQVRQTLREVIQLYTLRYLRAPTVIRRRWFITRVSPGSVVFYFVSLGCASVGNAVGVSDYRTAGQRAGILGLVFLIPLYLSTNMGFASSIFGISLERTRTVHRCLGYLSTVECILHLFLVGRHADLTSQFGICGALVSKRKCASSWALTYRNKALASIGILALSLAKRFIYELFVSAHLAAAVTLVVSLWLHVRNHPSKFYVLAAFCCAVLTSAIRVVQITYKNFRFSEHPSTNYPTVMSTSVEVRDHPGHLIKCSITLVKRWKIFPGQYMYLRVPGLDSTSWFQSHPFTVIDSTQGKSEYKQQMIVCPQSGWSRRIKSAVHSKPLLAVLEGPYGDSRDFSEYGTVMMIATGQGIFAFIPHIKRLIDGLETMPIKTRMVKVYWQLDWDIEMSWATTWLRDFLKRDPITRQDKTSVVGLALDISRRRILTRRSFWTSRYST